MKIHMLGHFDILYEGKSLLDSGVGFSKTAELLCFFLVHRGTVLKAEAVMGQLWPETEYHNPKTIMRTYIYRLRRMLESENKLAANVGGLIHIFNERNGYVLDLDSTVELDIERLARYCARVYAETDPRGAADLADKLADIYTGGFLANSNKAWTIRIRNQYLREFCGAVNHALDILLEAGELEALTDLCDKVFKAYDMDEGMNLRYMTALDQMGRKAYAQEHYSYITGKMYQEMGTAPSLQMRGLYSQLKEVPEHTDTAGERAEEAEEQVSRIVSDALRSYAKAALSEYTVAFIQLKAYSEDRREEQDVVRDVEARLQKALRRNDMYVVFNSKTAVAILVDTNSHYFSVIENRLNAAFSDTYTLRMTLSPIQNVIL